MTADEILAQLTEGTVLEGPYWAEPVKVLTAKTRGNRIEVRAVGLHTERLWNKLLTADDFDGAITVQQAGQLAALDGNPTHFRLAAEAHRIRLAYQYDPHFAVSVSQVDPLPHQMDAVYSHLLTQPRIRFLIADDPGAGKTVMAGLILKELVYRRLVKRVLIVAPGHLKYQWQREMKERFQESFAIVDRARMESAWAENAWGERDRCITSIDFVKQDDVRASLRSTHWDLVIVDEAHKMSAYAYQGRDLLQ